MRLQRFLDDRWFQERYERNVHAVRMACRRGRLKATGAVGTNGSHAVEDGSRLLEVRGDRLSGSVMERAA